MRKRETGAGGRGTMHVRQSTQFIRAVSMVYESRVHAQQAQGADHADSPLPHTGWVKEI